MRNIVILLVIGIMGALLLTGCPSPPPSGTATPAPTGTSAAPGTPAAPATPGEAATPGAQPKVKLIWDYDKELGLSAEQIDKMKKAVGALQKNLLILRVKKTAAELELRKLNEEGGAAAKVKAKLGEIAKIEADMRFIDLETAKKINTILSKEQLTKWRTLQIEERKAQLEKMKEEQEKQKKEDKK